MKLDLVDILPPFHSISTQTFENVEYYRAEEVMKKFFKTHTKPSKFITNKSKIGSKHDQ